MADGRQSSDSKIDVHSDVSRRRDQVKDGYSPEKNSGSHGLGLSLSRMGSRTGEPIVLCVSDLRYIVSSATDARRDLRDIFGNDDRDGGRDRAEHGITILCRMWGMWIKTCKTLLLND